MSMGYRGKTTNKGRENVAVQAQAERASMFGELTGTVVSFDPATQTASIQPDYKPVHNGDPVAMPQLDEVPVRFPRAGGFVITFPVAAGDKVVLRPQMRSTEEFHTGGDYVTEGDYRSMNLSDMEAHLAGGEALTTPIPAFNANNLEIRTESGAFAIEMSEDGLFQIRGKLGFVLDLLTQVVEKLAVDALQVNYGSSSGSGHALQYRADYVTIAQKLRGMVL